MYVQLILSHFFCVEELFHFHFFPTTNNIGMFISTHLLASLIISLRYILMRDIVVSQDLKVEPQGRWVLISLALLHSNLSFSVEPMRLITYGQLLNNVCQGYYAFSIVAQRATQLRS